MRKSRILFVASHLPFPGLLLSGHRWMYALARRLSRRFQVEIFSFLPKTNPAAGAAAALELERRWGVPLRLAPHPEPGGAGPPAHYPDWARRVFSPGARARLRREIARGGFDLVHFHSPEMAHDRRAAAGLPAVLTDVECSHFLPEGSYLPQDGDSPLPEWRRRVRHARAFYPRFDAVTVVSRADADVLAAAVPGVRPLVVPLTVDARGAPEGRRVPGSVLLAGSFRHAPNEDAAVFLCREILPRLRRRLPKAEVWLVGPATPRVRALAGPGVVVAGAVPDAAPYYARAAACAAPMRLGGGVKGKMLEAFAAGCPVVATPLAADALDAPEARRALLRAETAEDFAAALEGVLASPARARALARAARSMVRRRFDDGVAARAFTRLYRRLLRAGGKARREKA